MLFFYLIAKNQFINSLSVTISNYLSEYLTKKEQILDAELASRQSIKQQIEACFSNL